MQSQKKKRNSIIFSIVAVVVNVVLFIFVSQSVTVAINTANENTTIQNVANIRTLTEASADKVSIEVSHYFENINVLAKFINAGVDGSGMTDAEIKNYFTQFFSGNADGASWIMVDQETQGTSSNRYYPGVILADATASPRNFSTRFYGELAELFAAASATNINDEPKFSSEMTEPETAKLGFFLAKTIRVKVGESYAYKTLLHFVETDSLIGLIASDNVSEALYYEDYSGTIVDKSGDYIIKVAPFMHANFCDYFKEYNPSIFTEKERDNLLTKLNSGVAQDIKEPIYLVNNEHEDCIYTLASINNTEWYVLSVAPLSSFRITYDFSHYLLRFALLFIALFVVDIGIAIILITRLRMHMKLEMIANASRGNFMSRMSHEIRTPLNAIIGYILLATTSLNNAKSEIERRQAEMKALDCLSKSNIASKHLLTIINDVLDMSAIDSGRIAIAHDRFDFKGLITSLTTVFYTQAKTKGISFDVIFESLTDEWFIGDQMRINQIITNLLSNAIKFTHEGGSVCLTIKQMETTDGVAHVHFEVADTGIGMADSYLSRIWLPFEQADSSISRRFGGSGLGLSITKNLVDLMGGTISVKSVPNQGTTFFVDLKLEITPPPHANNVLYDFSSINALIVDDDISTCEYVRTLFNHYGARSAAVTSGEDAIKAVAKSIETNDQFSFCLVDWCMPNMDGIETIKHIREIAGSNLLVIVITAYDFSEIADQIREYNVAKCISKPLFQSTLFDILMSVCSKEQPKLSEISEVKNVDLANSRVLLVEDNEMNMEIARRIMESAGIMVDCAWNGEEAIKKFTACAENTYIAILMDVHMPVMDGYTATKLIRNSTHPEAKTIPIIAMTADAFTENVAEALAMGMNAHIAKPINVQVLFDQLTKCLKKNNK